MYDLTINIELSQQVAKALRPKPKLGQCYYNSWRAFEHITEHPEKYPGITEIYYCEGYVVAALILEHGWLEIDGQIVDVTFWKESPPFYAPTLRLDETARYAALQHTTDGALPLHEAFTWGRGGAAPDETICDLHHENLQKAFEFKRKVMEGN